MSILCRAAYWNLAVVAAFHLPDQAIIAIIDEAGIGCDWTALFALREPKAPQCAPMIHPVPPSSALIKALSSPVAKFIRGCQRGKKGAAERAAGVAGLESVARLTSETDDTFRRLWNAALDHCGDPADPNAAIRRRILENTMNEWQRRSDAISSNERKTQS